MSSMRFSLSTLLIAQSKVESYHLITAYVRTTLGTLMGVATYFVCLLLLSKENSR